VREHEAARAWREKLGLDRSQLSELTGYSREAITDYERGMSRKRTWSTKADVHEPKPIDKKIMQRYRLCCAGVMAQLRGEKFEW
jgi:DNA-binding XRE family transcriptional regulator